MKGLCDSLSASGQSILTVKRDQVKQVEFSTNLRIVRDIGFWIVDHPPTICDQPFAME